MKLFGRTPGYYLFWAGAGYVVIGLVNVYFKVVDSALLSALWIVCLLVPLTIPKVATYFNMYTIWDQLKPRNYNMDETKDNVYNLPTPKLVPPMPKVDEPEESSTKPAYLIGRTEDGRVTLRMGNDTQWSQLTMNNEGVDSLIRMLEAAKDE